MYRFIRNLTSAISNCGQKQGKLDINEVQRIEIMGLKQLQQPFYNTNNFKELKLYSYKLVYTKMKTTYYDVRGI